MYTTNKTRVLSLTLAFVLCLTLFPVVALPAYAVTSGDYTYEIANGGVHITGYNGTTTDVVIPAQLDETNVTAIAPSAFKGNTKVTSIVVPSNVMTIEPETFSGCTKLTSLTLSSKTTQLNYKMIAGTAVETITIPKTVTTMPNYCSYSENLSSSWDYNRDRFNTEYGEGVFTGANALRTVVFENGISTIPTYALYDAKSVRNVTIPASVTTINKFAFHGCVALRDPVLCPMDSKQSATTPSPKMHLSKIFIFRVQ